MNCSKDGTGSPLTMVKADILSGKTGFHHFPQDLIKFWTGEGTPSQEESQEDPEELQELLSIRWGG